MAVKPRVLTERDDPLDLFTKPFLDWMHRRVEIIEMVDSHEKMKPTEVVMPPTSGAEAHMGRHNPKGTKWGTPKKMTPEEYEVATERFNMVTNWITDGRIWVIRQEDGEGFRMFYRTVNGYEFGPEYADDGVVFAHVALAVQAAGGS